MFFDFLTSLKKFLRRLGDYQKCCIDILQSENLGVFRKMFSGILCVLVSKIKRSRDEITNFRQLTNVWVSLDPSIADYYSRSEIALCVSHASRVARSFVTESRQTADRAPRDREPFPVWLPAGKLSNVFFYFCMFLLSRAKPYFAWEGVPKVVVYFRGGVTAVLGNRSELQESCKG